MNVDRLKRTSSLFSAASLIITAVLLIALVVVVVAGMAIVVNEGLMSRIAEEIAPQTFVKNDIYLIILAVCMCVPLMAAMFFLAYKLFMNINTSGTPFGIENVKTLKWISYILLILAIPVSITAEALIAFYSSWGNSTINAAGSFALILVAVIFYFMAHVFEYGAALQKESDETL